MQHLHTLFYLKTDIHISGVNATHHQEGKQLYLQHLVFVTQLLLPAAIVEELERSFNSYTRSNSSKLEAGCSNGVTNNKCCRYS